MLRLGLHFSLLIVMLFGRIYLVFDNTQYQVSRASICIFTGLCLFSLADIAAFVFVVLYTNDDSHLLIFALYTIGIITIVLITIWITSLYIFKLFKVIKHDTSTAPKNDELIQNISKYALLTIIILVHADINKCYL